MGRAPAVVRSEAVDPTLRKIEKAAIVAQTQIHYSPQELLLLIHQHLVSSGLETTAQILLQEAVSFFLSLGFYAHIVLQKLPPSTLQTFIEQQQQQPNHSHSQHQPHSHLHPHPEPPPPPTVSLDSMVTQFLRDQHQR